MRALNYLGFQAGWFACVAGAGRELYWLGPLVAAALLTGHVWAESDRPREAKRLLAVAAFGLALELVAASLGRHRYEGPALLLPLWVAALWLLFAATLNSSFAWLSGRLPAAAALGAIAGPLSFQAGVALGAGQYTGSPASASAVLSVLWAVALPGAFVVSNRFSRRSA